MKYQFLKKIYDVINKVCPFKFEILPIFKTFPLPSMTTGTTFTFFNLIWRLTEPGDLSFYCTVRCSTRKCTSMQNLKNSMLVPFAYS